MINNVFIPFTVSDLGITTTRSQGIPRGNQNYIYARFNFFSSWDGMNKIAIFSKDGNEPIHVPIVDNVCQIPNELLKDAGAIDVSVFAGDKRTVDVATIKIIKSGYKDGIPPLPPEPSSLYVQSPDSTIPFIREFEDNFQYFARGDWQTVQGGGGGTSDLFWRPTVDVNGNISWVRSTSTIAPQPQNIKGPPGTPGAQGIQGIPGTPGKDGERGPQGNPGADGRDGIDGKTPVKGVDYFTSADIESIIVEVLSRIPVDTSLEARLGGI